MTDQVYAFAFKGLLADQALDRAGRPSRTGSELGSEEISSLLSLELLDERHLQVAQSMALVYVAIATFENSVRQLVTSVLLEAVGDNWWDSCVSTSIKRGCVTRQDDEAKHRFHTQRGDSPINYTDFKNLSNIIRANWDHFEDFLPSAEWATSIFDAIEHSRNVIMHSGTLDPEDVARIGVNLRDWVKQVGS